jgi:hypothetical protein
MERRRAKLEEGAVRYLSPLDTIDRQEPSETLATKTIRLKGSDRDGAARAHL